MSVVSEPLLIWLSGPLMTKAEQFFLSLDPSPLDRPSIHLTNAILFCPGNMGGKSLKQTLEAVVWGRGWYKFDTDLDVR